MCRMVCSASPGLFGAFRAVTAEALSFLQEISHLLYTLDRVLDLPKSGENVVLEDVAMSCVSGRTALVLVVDLLPAENIVF